MQIFCTAYIIAEKTRCRWFVSSSLINISIYYLFLAFNSTHRILIFCFCPRANTEEPTTPSGPVRQSHVSAELRRRPATPLTQQRRRRRPVEALAAQLIVIGRPPPPWPHDGGPERAEIGATGRVVADHPMRDDCA